LSADGQFSVGVHIDGAMVRCNYLTLRNYLTMAYDVKDYQLIAPDWMGADHFDIVAKRPDGSGDQDLRGMVASLLADRFKLVMHRETRDLPAYALVVGKGGLKIKELPPDAESADTGKVDVTAAGGGRGGTVVNLGNGSYISYGLNKLEAKKVNFPSLIDSLAKLVDRPVVDMTDLKGRYDFTLEYSVDELRTMVRGFGGRQPDSGHGRRSDDLDFLFAGSAGSQTGGAQGSGGSGGDRPLRKDAHGELEVKRSPHLYPLGGSVIKRPGAPR
jgi:uncharacterized protein (TIGR03435 family)